MSTKAATRKNRHKSSRIFYLNQSSKLPPQEMLSVEQNKIQLIRMIKEHLMQNAGIIAGTVYITANERTPVEISFGNVLLREDMALEHDEADTAIIQQLIYSGSQRALVLADDTDVFALLCHFVHVETVTGQVHMASPKAIQQLITSSTNLTLSINATALEYPQIMPNLLAAHALTGCDTVASFFGIGKQKMLKFAGSTNLDALGTLFIFLLYSML
jgi:hypothetical protein